MKHGEVCEIILGLSRHANVRILVKKPSWEYIIEDLQKWEYLAGRVRILNIHM